MGDTKYPKYPGFLGILKEIVSVLTEISVQDMMDILYRQSLQEYGVSAPSKINWNIEVDNVSTFRALCSGYFWYFVANYRESLSTDHCAQDLGNGY